ncbi:FAD-binding oxidoreductase [Alteromonas sp. a30]|uniref:FAD-binding oxidoreductase n=1 Tax=Alteromonas sp. a30 TaxID=2730917 RepID=UPI00227E5AA3|nr:FAD-binding oxidoreductase [Alteromonas sp. a30]MCY7295031.1 FAD-binding oxidoreductase [Alteromonas sp. a30]
MSITLSPWNRYPKISSEKVISWTDRTKPLPKTPMIAYANGRSYSDVCLTSDGTPVLTRPLNKFIEFDRQTGKLKAEAGVTLQEILTLVVPQGWFLQVTPGTQFVTLGGALANDVHGKNHHSVGSFGNFVLNFELLRSDGQRLVCSPDTNQQWFEATIGGLGLTGLIVWVEIQLQPINNPAMVVQSESFSNLTRFWDVNSKHSSTSPYTVAWLDCAATGRKLGRGVFFAGRHAGALNTYPTHPETTKSVPIESPVSLINRFSLKAFNALYARQPTKPEGFIQHYIPYFYPLDAIKNWNRLYGKKGFFQYQCVLPMESAPEGLNLLLKDISKSGQGSFLAVLKTFGDIPSKGLLSFPRPGATLALDFANRGNSTLRLLSKLDEIVKDHGGALYPAKDGRMSSEMFKHSFPLWEHFSESIDPYFCSDFWSRVSR